MSCGAQRQNSPSTTQPVLQWYLCVGRMCPPVIVELWLLWTCWVELTLKLTSCEDWSQLQMIWYVRLQRAESLWWVSHACWGHPLGVSVVEPLGRGSGAGLVWLPLVLALRPLCRSYNVSWAEAGCCFCLAWGCLGRVMMRADFSYFFCQTWGYLVGTNVSWS